ncbi:L-asparaginase 1-like [Amia ocellicauda]|uniref:L-asparaginase 1-like n=1 Tax=Amia ocellicauda TaxID=2972642 RepID=UPI003464DECD
MAQRNTGLSSPTVFMYYTGGTVGMVHGQDGEHPGEPGKFTKELQRHPELYSKEDNGWFHLPQKAFDECGEFASVKYQVEEVPKPIDSSKMTPADWENIAHKILDQDKKGFDGFVILHGTDTLAYTSSALSFLLQGLNKPVVVTGAQRSLFEPRSDAVSNILGSLLIAGCYCKNPALQQVCVFFHNKLFQGNRVQKSDCDAFDAFDSPNMEPLAVFGPTIKVSLHQSAPCVAVDTSQPVLLFPLKKRCDKVPVTRVLRIFPGISKSCVNNFLAQADGIVLQTYGNGNAPEEDWFSEALKRATDHGVLIINCTQVHRGSVRPIYEAGDWLKKAGVLSGYDITTEAALTKMQWVLQHFESKEWCKVMQMSVCGEMTIIPEPMRNGCEDAGPAWCCLRYLHTVISSPKPGLHKP